jgi:hypothetical protein
MMQLADEIIAFGNKVFDDIVAVNKSDRNYDNTIKPIAKFESK